MPKKKKQTGGGCDKGQVCPITHEEISSLPGEQVFNVCQDPTAYDVIALLLGK